MLHTRPLACIEVINLLFWIVGSLHGALGPNSRQLVRSRGLRLTSLGLFRA